MGMEVSWIAQDKKKKQTLIEMTGDTGKMRKQFEKFLMEQVKKDEIGDDQIMVSQKNPFYSAKTKDILAKLADEGKSLYLGSFCEDENKLKLKAYKEIELALVNGNPQVKDENIQMSKISNDRISITLNVDYNANNWIPVE
ncbi:MAG: hypothetical protein PUB98_10220 [Clostridiales bacterium]|nr:hypothetical protein [Clostridiales bacterium]